MNSPRFDVIVFGATSFVGQILCRYLLEQFGVAGKGKGALRWAAAGRSMQKLEALRSDLGAEAAALSLIVADAADDARLREMCAQTRVVVSTVGPYALHGEPLVRVCAESGTDYCDLTGELHWIRRMIDTYGDTAKASGARIVNCCGFDSIPSDLGVWFLQRHAREQFGTPCLKVKMRVKAMRGGASGGTAASLVNVIREAVASPRLMKELADPYSLCVERGHAKVSQPTHMGPAYDADMKAWIAPFVMGAINTRIVLRTNTLLEYAYGALFEYDEAMVTGRGIKGGIGAAGLTAGFTGFLAGAALPPTRWLLEKFVLPAPGAGPSRKAQQAGFFDLRFVGRTADGRVIRTKVTGDRDPGYGSTAKMLGQAAACLAKDISKKDVAGGFWTPASIFGDKLIARLSADAGLTFSVLEDGKKSAA